MKLRALLLFFVLISGSLYGQDKFTSEETTHKWGYLYTYVAKLYVDDVDMSELAKTAMTASAEFVDSTKAQKYVRKFHQKEDPLQSYIDMFEHINKIAPDSMDRVAMVETGIRHMLYELDPHTVYIPSKEFEQMNAPLKGNFEGIGIRFQILKDTLLVVNTIPGGPSEQVGLRAGDRIIFVDDENIAGVGLKNSGVRDRLLGDKGTVVNVKVKRKGEMSFLDFDITRDKIPINSLDAAYMATPEIGYIKLNNFSSTTMREFREAMETLKQKGMTKLILDLQGNGGGYMGTAIDLADQFLSDNKMVVYTQGSKSPKSEFKSTADGDFEKGELVVLIDEGSASASEIVTGAVQDWDRGLVIGRRSFGKGLVQQQLQLPDNSAIRLTIKRYYTPSGRSIQKPYDDGLEAYQLEKYKRYENGELMNADKIEFPDSLKYSTRITKRTVYGGGGIMPDVFVPLDTSGTSSYFSALIRKGHLNNFVLEYINSNREELLETYPDFETYKANFDPLADGTVKKLTAYAEKEGLELNKADFEVSRTVIGTRLKASIASNLWDFSKFYEVINTLNPSLEQAIEILENGSYHKMKLAQKN